jgi:CRP-like cAMP-binding protein
MTTVEHADKAEFLGNLGLFSWLQVGQVQWLADQILEREFSNGQPIFIKDAPADSLYIVADGEVAFYDDASSAIGGPRRVLGPGDYFGEMILLSSEPHAADAVAHGSALLFALGRQAFMEMKDHAPDQYALIVTNLARELARRIRFWNEHMQPTAPPDAEKPTPSAS